MASGLREFVQLAKTYTGKENVAAWYWSIKLDGRRCYWDGGITRGIPTLDVPWANTLKDGRYIQPPIATGLWSRYGKSIQAPEWFLDELPDFPLDGELWMGPGKFQNIMSTTSKLIPGDDWEDVQYKVFDSPSYREIFQNGEIRLKGKYEKVFRDFDKWAIERAKTKDPFFLTVGKKFEQTYELLRAKLHFTQNMSLLAQEQLPYNVIDAREMIEHISQDILKKGHEGVIVRGPSNMWVPKRVSYMLKVKPELDGEGKVVGYVWGEKTELGSKLLGLMGSVIVEWKGIRFKLSGFTDTERQMYYIGHGTSAKAIGCEHPGQLVQDDIHNPRFPRGTVITFKYRELTNDGIPKEARFMRVRPDE